MKGVIAIVLLWNSIYDWKYKKISLPVTGIGLLVTIAILIFSSQYTWKNAISGMSVGIFIIICSFLTRGQIGIGDGIISCFIGTGCGFFENLNILFCAFTLAAIVSAVLLIRKKVKKKTRIPFVPFLFIGYCCIQVFQL